MLGLVAGRGPGMPTVEIAHPLWMRGNVSLELLAKRRKMGMRMRWDALLRQSVRRSGPVKKV